MKVYLIERNGFRYIELSTQIPIDSIGMLPSYIKPSDYPFVIKDEHGVIRICEKKKKQYIKDQLKNV